MARAVQIELSLRRRSPQNGNVRGRDRRLWAVSASRSANWESRDEAEWVKNPHFGLFSRFLASLAERGNAWLATQCTSHPSPRKFPANREFYRENHDFGPQDDNPKAKNRCATGTFQQIPYINCQGNFSEEQGILSGYQGTSAANL